MIVFSISIFFTFFTKLLHHLIYGKRKVYCYPLIFSAVLLISGCCFTFSTLSNFEVYDGLPEHSFQKREAIYEQAFSTPFFRIPFLDYQIKEDDTLKDDQVKIIISYYEDFVSDIETSKTESNDTTSFHVTAHHSVLKPTREKMYHMVIDELKHLRWYHYSELNKTSITVFTNHNTMSKIK